MIGELRPFGELMEDTEVKVEAAKHFSNLDWQSRFLVVSAMCCVAIPQSDMRDGLCLDGACVFYVDRAAYDLTEMESTPIYDPWVFKVDLGSCANYRFEKVGDYTHSFNASDSEEFQLPLFMLLEGSLWLPVRAASSIWQ